MFSAEQPIVTAIQMVSDNDIAVNMKVATRMMTHAVQDEGSSLLVLPENFLAFGSAGHATLSEKSSYYLESLKQIASNLSCHIVAGSLPVPAAEQSSTQRFFSRSHLINASGELVDHYDKIHLFDVDVKDGYGAYRESDTFQAGKKTKVIDLGFCKLGFSICYDLRFPSLFQQLVAQGAEVIVVPAAFTKVTGEAHWEILLRARAIETQCYIIAANQGGTHSDKRQTWGHSMIIDPWGEILSRVERGEAICSSHIDLPKLHALRSAMPVQKHIKIF